MNWIKCEYRLPKKGQKILLFRRFKNELGEKKIYKEIIHFDKGGFDKEFNQYIFSALEPYPYCFGEVKKWKPYTEKRRKK